MPSNLPKVSVRLTPAQLKALTDAVTASNVTQAEWLRQAIASACEAQGIVWIDDYPSHGGNRHGGDDTPKS